MGLTGDSSPGRVHNEKTHRDSLLSTFGSGKLQAGAGNQKRLASLSPSPPSETPQDPPSPLGTGLMPSTQTLQAARMAPPSSPSVATGPSNRNGEAREPRNSPIVDGAPIETFHPVRPVHAASPDEEGPAHPLPGDYESLSKAAKWRKVPLSCPPGPFLAPSRTRNASAESPPIR
jgi:hypothetical protein